MGIGVRDKASLETAHLDQLYSVRVGWVQAGEREREEGSRASKRAMSLWCHCLD